MKAATEAANDGKGIGGGRFNERTASLMGQGKVEQEKISSIRCLRTPKRVQLTGQDRTHTPLGVVSVPPQDLSHYRKEDKPHATNRGKRSGRVLSLTWLLSTRV